MSDLRNITAAKVKRNITHLSESQKILYLLIPDVDDHTRTQLAIALSGIGLVRTILEGWVDDESI